MTEYYVRPGFSYHNGDRYGKKVWRLMKQITKYQVPVIIAEYDTKERAESAVNILKSGAILKLPEQQLLGDG